MKQRACVYGELDSYTGYIRHDYADLPKLIRDLKFCCLFYDDVIVNTGVILDHPLTLPAFELMSPFVKSGRLWTTGRDTENSPTQFINDRIDRFYGKHPSKKSMRPISEVIERWQTIAPQDWRLKRKLSVQVGSATQNIINNLSALNFSHVENYQKEIIIAHVEMMHSDGVFDRDLTLAKIAAMQGVLSAPNLSTMSLLVQAELMNQATRNKGRDAIVLFPGMFLRKVHVKNELFQQEKLSVDSFTIKKAISTFSTLGYSLSGLLSLPIDTLHQLSESSEWINFRTFLLSNKWNNQHSREMYSMYLRKLNFHTASSIILRHHQDILFDKTPITTSSAWQLYGIGNLGNFNNRVNSREAVYVLDLPTRKVYFSDEPNKSCLVSYKQSVLLAVLICAGRYGVSTAQLEQLDIEQTQVKHDKFAWYTHHSDDVQARESRMDRISVAKIRLNQILKPLKIKIDNANGRWTLRSVNHLGFKIKGSYWQTPVTSSLTLCSSIKLTPQSQKLWSCLVSRTPYYVNMKLISRLLFDCEDVPIRKISDAVYKLKKQLSSTPFEIIKNCAGEYALVSKQE